jgi:hypothetical protein
MYILVRSFGITVATVIERQSALFPSTLLPLNLSVCTLGLYALTEVQRQSYLLLCISLYSLRPVWPNSGLIINIKYYRSRIIIFTARALTTLRLKVYSDNNDFNALIHGSIILRHLKFKVFIGKTF